MAVIDSTSAAPATRPNGIAKTVDGASSKMPNGAGPVASTSYLPASSALAELEKYPKLDGLSLSELMDSQQHGGLTCACLTLMAACSIDQTMTFSSS